MASLADLLDYDQRKKQALQALTDYASSQYKLGSAFGEGLSDQAKGLVQMAAHPWDTGTQMYEAGKAALQNPKAALQAAKEGLTEAVSSPENISRFAGQNFNPLELANALKNVGIMREIVVHHGTPHRFEPTEANPLGEFNASKIGTGEGNQAYGHGIYLAESPDVAKEYQEKLSTNVLVNSKKLQTIPSDNPLAAAHNTVITSIINGMNPKEAINHAIKYWSDAADEMALQKTLHPELESHIDADVASKMDIANAASTLNAKSFYKEPGHLYKADLPDEMVDRMLDWDKPLSMQPKAVQKAWQEISEEFGVPTNENEMIGPVAMRAMLEPEFQKRGIPGIKYQDAGSRGQAGTGTRNFVVFPGEEKKVKILERK